MHRIQVFMEDCEDDPPGITVVDCTSSSRGGKCLGIRGSLDKCRLAVAHVVDCLYAEVEEADELQKPSVRGMVFEDVKLLLSYTINDLGHKTMFVWPQIKYVYHYPKGSSPVDPTGPENVPQQMLEHICANK